MVPVTRNCSLKGVVWGNRLKSAGLSETGGRNHRRVSWVGILADLNNADRPTKNVKPNGHGRSEASGTF